eukprot:4378278-Karenia_brevis.AAC.1
MSDKTQAELGMIKDMRDGQVFLRDHDDYIDVYRDSRTGIRVINVSHFPEDSASLPRSAFVADYHSAFQRTTQHYWTETPREVTPPRSEIEETEEWVIPEPESLPDSDEEDAESGRTPVAMPATPNSG